MSSIQVEVRVRDWVKWGAASVVVAATGLAIGPRFVSAGQAPDVATILAETRTALGGDKKLSAIASFVATGRTRQIRGDNLVPTEFEISVQLPDKYVRRDEVPAQESGPTSTGFNGDGLIQLPLPPPTPAAPPPAASPATATAATAGGAAAPASAGTAASPASNGRAAAPPMSPADAQAAARLARVTTVKQDFTKLTLGMFAASLAGYPVTFTYAGHGESPQGTADVIEVKGAGNFDLHLFVSAQTHLPLLVSWTTPATAANIVITVAGQPKPTNLAPGAIVVEAPAPPPATASADEQAQYTKDIAALRTKTLASAKPIPNYIYYSDYRDAGGGVLFPFRLRRAIASDTVEETNFDGFKLNAKIDPKKFEVVK